MPRFAAWQRFLMALLVFAALCPLIRAYFYGDVVRLLLRGGERLGFQVFRISGRVAFGPDGPFYDAPRWANQAYYYGLDLLLLLPPLVMAVGVYHLLSLRRRAPDGFARCRKCDHILKGLTAPRCPECGTAI